MLLDPTDRMHGPLAHAFVWNRDGESSRRHMFPRAALIDPLIHDEWDRRLAAAEASRGAWL